MNDTTKRWPGYADEAHPEIFNAVPPQPEHLKPGQIREDDVKRFFDEGYLAIDSFFKPEELDPGKKAIDGLVDELANKLYKAGKIKSLYTEYGYDKRLTMIEADFPGAAVILHKIGKLPQALRAIWSNERLLNLIEQLLGTSDIMGHPVWNLRTKTPNNKSMLVPWHQDAAYMDNRSYSVLQITAWIPMMDATLETGCLQLLRGGQKKGRICTHVGVYDETWQIYIEEDEMCKTLDRDLNKDAVPCPIKYGGIILFTNVLPHCGLANTSDVIRWSLDFRWQRSDRNVGFYGMKEGVLMRSSTDQNLTIDWEPFDAVKRHDTQSENVDEFDTTIAGPWMLKWEMKHSNRHTAALPTGDSNTWNHLILG